jgi:hypothetical protein
MSYRIGEFSLFNTRSISSLKLSSREELGWSLELELGASSSLHATPHLSSSTTHPSGIGPSTYSVWIDKNANNGTEISPTSRAGCKVTACKEAGAKIKKGEIRLGVWVTYAGGEASWAWRHWYVNCLLSF